MKALIKTWDKEGVLGELLKRKAGLVTGHAWQQGRKNPTRNKQRRQLPM